MQAAAGLGAAKSLLLVNSFEPKPLIRVLGARAFECRCTEVTPGGMARTLHTPAAVATAPIRADAPFASVALIALGVVFHVGGSLMLVANASLAALHAFAAFSVLAVVAVLDQLLPVLLGVTPLSWKLTSGTGLGFAGGFVFF